MTTKPNAVAYEFFNEKTGHAIVDYTENTYAGQLTARNGYTARPLVYADEAKVVSLLALDAKAVEAFMAAIGAKAATQPTEVEKLMDAAGLCRRCAAPTQPTTDEITAIRNLIDLARQVDHALDDSEEVDYGGFRSHNIAGQDFDDVVEALDALEDLPDDKPGMTLGPAGKAEWALRRLLPNTEVDRASGSGRTQS